MNKFKGKLLLIIGIIYFLFSLFLFALNFNNFSIIHLIGLIISIVLIILSLKKHKNSNLNKILFWVILSISILFRLSLLFLNYSNLTGDYIFFFDSARSYASNLSLASDYISAFPYTYSYIFLLGNIMKIMGSSYITIVISNIIFELLGSLIFYLFFKSLFNKDLSKKALLIWLVNPFNILWITKCCPVILVNTLIMLVLFLFLKISQSTKINRSIILSIILGLTLSLTNAFRPIMIIFLIAYFIYIIFKFDKTKLLLFLITIFSYILLNIGINAFISNSINRDLPKNVAGWTLFVGANTKYNGMWNIEDSDVFNKSLNEIGASKTQKLLEEKGIERYKENGLQNITLLVKKSAMLGTDLDGYTYDDVFYSIENPINEVIELFIKVYLSIFMYMYLIINVVSSYKVIKNKYYDSMLPYGIFMLGLFLSTILVEVSKRYFIPLMIPLFVFIIMTMMKKRK